MATKTDKNKDTKKSKAPSQSEQDNNKRKSEALKKIVEHNRDYLKLDLTLPLGDTALKQVHTNQWLFTDLPAEFDLANWTIIAKQLNSNVNRWEGYVENRWYIESCDISVDESKAEMKLGLNAFASTVSSYSDAFKAFEKAYTDATNKATTSTAKTSASKSTTNAVTTGENKTVKNGWWGWWVTKMVRDNVGNETDTLKKCKIMYNVFCKHIIYKLYYNAKKTYSGVKSYEGAWNKNHLNCGDGANILTAFMACCGAKPTILNGSGCGYGHYVVKVVINGAVYWCDHAASTGAHTTRGWNHTFCNIRSGSSEGTHINYP